MTFITLCKAFFWIAPHFTLWRWVFQAVLSFLDGAFSMTGVPGSRCGRMLLDGTRHCLRAGGWRSCNLEVELALPPQHGPGASILHNGEAGRRHTGIMGAIPLAAEAVDVPSLMGAIEALREQGLNGLVIIRMFIERRILPLREWSHPLWTYEGFLDLMMEFLYLIPDTVLRVLMLDAAGMNYHGASVGPRPFSADHPCPANHPLARLALALVALSVVDSWEWMETPAMGMWEAPTLLLGLPPTVMLVAVGPAALAVAPVPVVVLAPMVHLVEVGGGSRRCQRIPVHCGQSLPRSVSLRRGK